MNEISSDELRDYASRVCVFHTDDNQTLLMIEIIGAAIFEDVLKRAAEYKEALLSAARQIDERNEQLAAMHRQLEEHPAMAEWRASR